jgi:hypothetical protein
MAASTRACWRALSSINDGSSRRAPRSDWVGNEPRSSRIVRWSRSLRAHPMIASWNRSFARIHGSSSAGSRASGWRRRAAIAPQPDAATATRRPSSQRHRRSGIRGARRPTRAREPLTAATAGNRARRGRPDGTASLIGPSSSAAHPAPTRSIVILSAPATAGASFHRLVVADLARVRHLDLPARRGEAVADATERRFLDRALVAGLSDCVVCGGRAHGWARPRSRGVRGRTSRRADGRRVGFD